MMDDKKKCGCSCHTGKEDWKKGDWEKHMIEHLKEMSKEDLQMKKDHLTKKLALIDKMIKEMK